MRSPAVFPALPSLPPAPLAAAEASVARCRAAPRPAVSPLVALPWPETAAQRVALLVGVPGWVELVQEARDLAAVVGGDPRYCRVTCYTSGYRDHHSFKRRIARLVGFSCDHADPRLCGQDAWNFTTRIILLALPDCLGCCNDAGEVAGEVGDAVAVDNARIAEA